MLNKDNNKYTPNWPKVFMAVIRLISIVGLAVSIFLVYKIYQLDIFSSDEALASFLGEIGRGAPLILIFLQAFRNVTKIIPAAIVLPVAVALFGQVKGLIYNTIGIIIGSVILFFLARNFGESLVKTIAGEKKCNALTSYLDSEEKFKTIFTIVIFSPIGPYDLSCMLAGLSDMAFKDFFIRLCIGKPISIFIYTNLLLSTFSFIGRLFN